MPTPGFERPLPVNDSTEIFRDIKTALVEGGEDGLRRYAVARLGGVSALLDLIFAQLPNAFLPSRAGGRAIGFQFVVDDRGTTHEYYADVRAGACRTGRGTLVGSTTTLTMTLADFAAVLVGTLAPVRAFLSQRIRVSGEMMAATKFESWFQRP